MCVLYGGEYELSSDDTYTYIKTNDDDLADRFFAYKKQVPNFSQDVLDMYAKNTLEAIKKEVQAVLDREAQNREYEDMKSVRSYTGFDNMFREECIRLATWCTDVWAEVWKIKQQYEAGEIGFPTVQYVLDRLPEYKDEG